MAKSTSTGAAMDVVDDLDSHDEFFLSSTWPIKYTKLLYKENKNDSEMFTLFLFFYINGMPPERAGYWCLYQRADQARRQYDVRRMVARAKAGAFNGMTTYNMYGGPI
jgi:hypothetical protein